MANNPYVNKVQLADGTSLIDISDTTATADKILQGYTAYSASGQKITGTATGGGGGSVTQDQDGYIVLPSTGGGSPSATQHVIHLEFTDSTDTDINVYYDDSLISTMITAYTPETYGQKTVDVAELDGVEWYHRPTAQWETVYDGVQTPISDTPYNYLWISDIGDVYPIEGEEWRVTVDDIVYYTTATLQTAMGHTAVVIGNPKYSGGQDDGSSIPLNLYNLNYGALMGDTELSANVQHSIKLERKISA